jgi:hypothetical protein
MKAMIIYDTGDGIVIYQAVLTAEEAVRMTALHNRYGGTVEMSEEDDKFLSDLENSIGDITKVFDASSEDANLMGPITAYAGAKVFVTGFVP